MTALEAVNRTWSGNSKEFHYSFKFGYFSIFYLVFMLSENINHMHTRHDTQG